MTKRSRRSVRAAALGLAMLGVVIQGCSQSTTERRIVTSILRSGPATAAELRDRLPDVGTRLFESSLALLLKDGAVRDSDGVLSAVQRRQVKAGTSALLDRLGDL